MLPERAILFALETETVYLKVISLNKRAKSGDVEDFNFRRVEHGEILSVSDSAKVSTEMHFTHHTTKAIPSSQLPKRFSFVQDPPRESAEVFARHL